MNFLNPLVLIGLIAAGIPILLHFLNLRKMKKVEFSTLRFLKELQKTKIRHLKIKRLLLLILRTLLIIFIVLAFARPIIEGTLPILETYANSSTVIIIDNSFSMDVSDEYGNRFNHSKLAAREILRQIGEGDEVTVLPMAGDFAAGMSDLTRNHALVSETLEQIDISNSEADLEKSLQMASLLLDNAANINREIFIISDAQANIFPEKENRGAFPYPVNIYFMNLSARSGSEIKNLAVDSLNVISRIFQPGKPVETEAYIRNSSSNPVEDVVVSMAFNGKRVTQRAIDLNANALSTIPISFAPTERGSYKGALEIEGDALDIDNKRYFGFTIPKSPEILLAGSDASIRFIRLAVKEFNRDSDFANARIVDPGQFSAFNLENYEMVLLAGGDFRESDYMKVRNYVNNGGSAMIFGGEEDSNELFSALKALGFGAISITSYDEANPMRFSSIDRQHPVFEGVFSGETDNKKIVESPDIYSVAAAKSGQHIISIPGGGFLSEARPGEGKVLYCAVPPTSEWSNLPVTGIFPTILYRAVTYLTAREEAALTFETGKPFSIMLPSGFGSDVNIRVVDPMGNESYHQASRLPAGLSLSMKALNIPGVYELSNNFNNIPLLVAVNTPSSESLMSYYDNDEVNDILSKKAGEDSKIRYIEEIEEIGSGIEKARTGTELWQLFVFLALITAVAEMLVAKSSKNELFEE